MTTEEGNKLIAEFMGCYGDTHYAGNEPVFRYGFKDTHITERWHESRFSEETPYHSSWDWIMPVVEKIEADLKIATMLYVNTWDNRGRYCFRFFRELDENGNIRNQLFEESVSDIKIECVYKAVLQFIQWYNTQQQEQKLKQ